jgi:hypothetical protein
MPDQKADMVKNIFLMHGLFLFIPVIITHDWYGLICNELFLLFSITGAFIHETRAPMKHLKYLMIWTRTIGIIQLIGNEVTLVCGFQSSPSIVTFLIGSAISGMILWICLITDSVTIKESFRYFM